MSYEICEECGHDPVRCHAAFDMVRELEAELAQVKGQNEALEEMYQAGTSLAAWKARAEKAEVRVAELEAERHYLRLSLMSADKLAEVEAREREVE